MSRRHKIMLYLTEQIAELQPSGILLDFLMCRQMLDNDLGSIVPSLLDENLKQRPCAILAKGRAAHSARNLLILTGIGEQFNVQVFVSRKAGLAFVLDQVSKQ